MPSITRRSSSAWSTGTTTRRRWTSSRRRSGRRPRRRPSSTSRRGRRIWACGPGAAARTTSTLGGSPPASPSSSGWPGSSIRSRPPEGACCGRIGSREGRAAGPGAADLAVDFAAVDFAAGARYPPKAKSVVDAVFLRGRVARGRAAGWDDTDAVLRVLILDDESIVVDTLAACLRLPGIELTTCMEIEAAEALLRCFNFDVVITDLSVSQLGGLDGMRLVRFVTANFPDTAVYVLSGYVDQAVRDLCSVLGVTAVLEKSEGLTRLRGYLLDRRAAGLAPGTVLEGEGEVQQVELLEEFMAANPIRAVLQPVVKLRAGAARFEVFGVESLARGPSRSVLGSPAGFLAYAAQQEVLFEGAMICSHAALTEVVFLGHTVTTFLNVQPRSLTNPDFASRLCDAVRAAGMAEKEI